MFTRHLLFLVALALTSASTTAHSLREHPHLQDECEDIPHAISWFRLYGTGVEGSREQDFMKPQFYRIKNDQPAGGFPRATVKLGWAMGAGHVNTYHDFILEVNVGNSRRYSNLIGDVPAQWVINPYIDGWTGVFTITLTHRRCPTVLKITAPWSFQDPCRPCQSITCPVDTEIGSVDIKIPVGITDYGRSPVALQYYAEDIPNQGVAKLAVHGPIGENGATSTKVDDVLTSVTTGDHFAAISPDPSDEDPNRFRVTVSYDKTDPATSIYREGVVENITLPGDVPAIRYTESVDGRSNTHVFSRPDAATWVLEENDHRRTTRTTLSESTTSRTRRITVEERTPSGQYALVSVHDLTETKYAWGWEKTREVRDPNGRAVTTTWDHYDHTETSAPDGSIRGRGMVERITYPTGRVRSFVYHDTNPLDPAFNQLTITRDAFAGTPDAREDRLHSTVSSTGITLTQRREVWINGIRTEHTDISASFSGGSPARRTETRYPHNGGPPQVTEYVFDHNVSSSREKFTRFPDGTIEQTKVYRNDGTLTEVAYRGVENPSYYGYPILTGTARWTITNDNGQVIRRIFSHIIDGDELRIKQTYPRELDHLSRLLASDVHFGDASEPAFTETMEYGCCGISKRTGRDGIPEIYYYDPLGHLRKTHRNGLASETVRDGLITRTHVYPESVPNSLSLATPQNEASAVTRDLSGVITAETTRSPHDHSLVTTTVATTYNPGNGIGRRSVRTLPATPDDLGVPATITEESWLDGRPATRSGPLVADRRFTYDVNATGITATSQLLAGDGTPYQPVTTQYDWLNRPIHRTYAGDADDNGQPDRETLAYDAAGRLIKQVDPDGVTRLWHHDLLNKSTTAAIDLNGNEQIDPSIDEIRITQSGTEINAAHQAIMWTEERVRDGSGSAPLLLRRETRADGFETWNTIHDGGASALTHALTTFPPDQPGAWDTTTTSPDQTSVVQRFRGGRLTEEESFDADGRSLGIRTHHYDPYQRLTQVVDSSAPDLLLTYVGPQVDVIASRQVGTRLSTFTHDHRGRLTVTDEPDSVDADGNPVDNRRTTTFWPHGQAREVSGTPGYRLAYSYDDALRLASLTTAGTTTAITRWEYDPDRGWLSAKRFHSPEPGQGNGPSFTYTPSGRPETRTNQRGIVTSHQYGPDGRLARTDYTDATPSTVVLERDRRGRIKRLTDGGGERSFTYDNLSALASVTHESGHLLAGWSVQQSRDSFQRLDGLTLRHGGSDQYHTSYQYDRAGRVESVQADHLAAFYQYDPDHGRVSQLSVNTTTGPVLFGTRQYDALNRLARISYHNGDLHGPMAVYSDYQYTRDAFGRITSATLRDKTQWRYAYHPSGELATAHRLANPASTTHIPGHAHIWTYDGIGNRLATQSGGDPDGNDLRTTNSTPNALNQPASIQRPPYAEVFGEAPLATGVTVNGTAASRHGPFFRHELAVANSATPVWQNVTITSGATTHTGHLLVPKADTAPVYDADGNLKHDGIFEFAWDAEDRLVSAQTTPAATAAGIPYAFLSYTYDSDSRLLERRHFDAPGATIPAHSTRYLYAGWRCLGELDATGQLTRTLAWGLDNHDTLHLGDPNAALLWLHDRATNESHLASYDGNGNLTALTSAHSRQPTARYLYSPFGTLLAATGPYADHNPYRFSTHLHDPTTNLTHYGHRWLNSETGSWISRDPLGEPGGPNLYGFAGNDAINHYDTLGLALYAFDGTSNKWEQQTNIGFLAKHYAGEVSYLAGVGNGFHGPLDNAWVGGVTGAGGKKRLEEMYQMFQQNYAAGDTDVDIIGFSRGAALARAFANMLYERGAPGSKDGQCRFVTIRFVGLFDTVASFGRPGNDVNLGYELDIPPNVHYVAHAVAKDEMRALFPVTMLNKPRGYQHFYEAGFRGDHSDIGAGHGDWKYGYWFPDNNKLSKAPADFVRSVGISAGAPFNTLPPRLLKNSNKPHNLATTFTGYLGPQLFGNIFDRNMPIQKRNIPDGYTQW